MKLLAVDSNSVLNRAYYGIRPLTTREGMHTNGIYGFLNIFFKICEEVSPDAVAFAFDLRAPTFRHAQFAGYKAQRKGMPPELAMQVEPLKELLRLMGYRILTAEGFEADDILGTLAAQCRARGDECVIATGDRDSFQLVGDLVTVRLAFTRGGQSGAEFIDGAAVYDKYGVSPHALIDVKALMGDASDNIPGVAGVGEKTALSLIADFKSLDGVYANLEDPRIKSGLRQKLESGREAAYQSRALAEICCEVPIGAALDDLRRTPMQEGPLYALLDKLELRSTVARLGLTPPSKATPEAVLAGVSNLSVWVNDADAARALCSAPLFAAVVWEDNRPAAFALLDEKKGLALLDAGCPSLERLLLSLAPQAGALTLSDSKEWYRFCYQNGVEPMPVSFDPTLAGYLLSPLASSYSFDALCAGRGLDALKFSLPDGLPDPLAALAQRMAQLPCLCAQLQNDLRAQQMDRLLFEIELPLARVLASMETLGFSLDAAGLRGYGEELDADIAEATARIWALAGAEFNLNSPKQLAEVLFEKLGLRARRKTKSGYSTDADTLEALRREHPIVEDILSYRKLAKLKSTYVDGLLGKIGTDGRVRSVFRQTETRTGRISSTEPNLQNIPVRTERGSRLRRFFVAAPGCSLVDADYSQIELRVLAHIADDPAMIDAFLHDADIHTKTASQVFDMPEEFVTPRMRSAAKAVNFGIVYGIGAFSLSQDIGVSVAEADRYIKSYLDTYAGVKKYMEDSVAFAREHGYAKTLFGRRRPLPELTASNHATRAFGERVAMNTPIQGTAADIIKIAMIRVFDRLREEGLRSRLILQVHDELILEAPENEVGRAAAIVTEEMHNAAALSVPLVADAGVGPNWLEAK